MPRYKSAQEMETDETDNSTVMVAENSDNSTKKSLYPYAVKIEFSRYTGNMENLENPPVDSKGKLKKQKMIEIAKRSQFFANQHGDKYKIIMVYKGAGNNKRQQIFDIVKKKDKLKYQFFKEKGIIL